MLNSAKWFYLLVNKDIKYLIPKKDVVQVIWNTLRPRMPLAPRELTVATMLTYNIDVTMTAMASQITGVSIVCSTYYSSKLRVTGLCGGNSPVTGGFPAQRVSNAVEYAAIDLWPFHMFIKWFEMSLRGLIVKSAEHCGADYKPLDRCVKLQFPSLRRDAWRHNGGKTATGARFGGDFERVLS